MIWPEEGSWTFTGNKNLIYQIKLKPKASNNFLQLFVLSESRNLIYVSIYLFSILLQSSKLGFEVWSGFMGVRKAIYENFRYQKCKYCFSPFLRSIFHFPDSSSRISCWYLNRFGIVTRRHQFRRIKMWHACKMITKSEEISELLSSACGNAVKYLKSV